LLQSALQHGVPLGRVRSIAEAYSSDEMQSQELLFSMDHPSVDNVPGIGAPFKMFGTPVTDPVAPPLLGQHTDEVLRDVLGYDAAKIELLRSAGALGSR
jgi:crotonobetainyl-CoA:carnitine CoA-transferase CaiB-like acyl-CoA transferase